MPPVVSVTPFGHLILKREVGADKTAQSIGYIGKKQKRGDTV
jgi:hypothetical protein